MRQRLLTTVSQESETAKNQPKTAIVHSGGAFSCAFGAGVLVALRDIYGFTKPDIAIASSGGAPNVSYFCSGQVDEGRQIYFEHLTKPGVVLNRGLIAERLNPMVAAQIAVSTSMGQIDRIVKSRINLYAVEHILRHALPLDHQAFFSASTHILLSLTDAETGRTHYFGNRDTNRDPVEMILGSMTLPIINDRRCFIGGREYLDGDIGISLVANIAKAIRMGATKIVAIYNKQATSLNTFYLLTQGLRVDSIRRAIAANLAGQLESNLTLCLYPGVDVVLIEPDQPLPTATLVNRPGAIAESFHRGYRAATQSRKLERLLAK